MWKLDFHSEEVPLLVVALAMAPKQVVVVVLTVVAVAVVRPKCEQVHAGPVADAPSPWIAEYP